MLTLNTVDTFNVDWMSSQALAGICSGVTIRISDHFTTAIKTSVTNMKTTIGICKIHAQLISSKSYIIESKSS